MNAQTPSPLGIAGEIPAPVLETLGVRLPPTADRARAQAGQHGRLGLGKPLAYGWLLGPALLIFYWSVGSASGYIDSRVLPAPWATVTTAIDLIRDGRLVSSEPPRDASKVDLKMVHTLAGTVDLAAERARLDKDITAARKAAMAMTAKLANPAFTGKAPADVVAKSRERLAAAEADIARLEARLATLA